MYGGATTSTSWLASVNDKLYTLGSTWLRTSSALLGTVSVELMTLGNSAYGQLWPGKSW